MLLNFLSAHLNLKYLPMNTLSEKMETKLNIKSSFLLRLNFSFTNKLIVTLDAVREEGIKNFFLLFPSNFVLILENMNVE